MATAKKPAAKDVTPAPSPARKDRYAALAKVIAGAKKDSARRFDALCEAIGEVIESALYLDGGFRSVNEYIAKAVKEPAEEERYGVAKLDAALARAEHRHALLLGIEKGSDLTRGTCKEILQAEPVCSRDDRAASRASGRTVRPKCR